MFVYPPRKSKLSSNGILFKKLYKICLLFSLVFSLVIFISVALNAYKYSRNPANLESIKLVKKEIAPLRITPPESERETMLNQDKFIYKNMENAEKSPKEVNTSKRDNLKKPTRNQHDHKGFKPPVENIAKEDKLKNFSSPFDIIKE